MANTALTELMLTITPVLIRAISRATACPIRNAPLRLTRNTASKSSSLTSRKSAARKMPALLTSTSIRPCNCRVCCTAASTCALLPTSQCTYEAPRPVASAAPRVSSTSAITTRAPSRAKRQAQAAPMPCAPPVTMTTLPPSPNETAPAVGGASGCAVMAWNLPWPMLTGKRPQNSVHVRVPRLRFCRGCKAPSRCRIRSHRPPARALYCPV